MKRKVTLYTFALLIVLSFFVTACTFPLAVTTTSSNSLLLSQQYYYNGLQNRLFGNYKKALQNFRYARFLDPTNDAIHYELALTFGAINQTDSSINCLQKALLISPDNASYHELIRDLYTRNNDIENALFHQKALTEKDTSFIYNKFQLAILYASLDSLDKSLHILESFDSDEGFNPSVIELKMKIFLQKNQIESASKELNKLKNFLPNDPYLMLFDSQLLFSQGYDSLGFSLLDTIISKHPDYTNAKFEMFSKQLTFGSTDRALNVLTEIFSDTLIADHDKANLFYPLLFEKNFYINRLAQLDSIVSIGLQIHPLSPYLSHISFEHYLRSNNLVKAKQVLLNILNKNPNALNVDNFEQLFQLQFALNEIPELIQSLNRAISLFPQHANFYVLKSFVYSEHGQMDYSLSALKQGIQTVSKPDEKSELYGALGDSYFQISEKRKAFSSYNKALKLNPNNARVLNNFAYYLAISHTSLKKALLYSSRAVELEPNSSTYIDTKGWVLFTMKRYEEARDVLRKAVAKDGGSSAVITEHYGDALYMSGNKENAYIYWLKAKDLGGDSESLNLKIKSKSYVP